MFHYLKKFYPTIIKPFIIAMLLSCPASLTAAADNEFYQELYQNLRQRTESFTVNYPGPYSDVYNGSNFEDIIAAVMKIHEANNSDDFDYLRWNYKTISFTCANNADNTSDFAFDVSYREPADRLNIVNQDVQAILPSLIGSNNLETIKNIHDFVVNKIEYDRTMQRYTAYEGLQLSSTVCQGYSLLTYKLLTEANIPCRIVSGYAGERHSWNIVKVGDSWYHLDCTWDDPLSSQPVLRYDYFLIGTNRISQDHQIDSEWLSAASMAQYPLSDNDFNDEYIAQENHSAMPDDVYQEISLRSEFNKILAASFDKSFAYENQDKYHQIIIDLYKKIVIAAVQNLPDDKFTQLAADEKNIDILFNLAEKHIKLRILDPLMAYPDSAEFTNAAEQRLLNFASQHNIDKMADDTWDKLSTKLAEQWAEELMEAEISRISQENTTAVIQELTQDLQAKLL